MKSRDDKFPAFLALGALLAGTVSSLANADLGPYDVIPKRNLFNLKEPVPPPPITLPPAPPVDIVLSGISSLSERMKAFLVTKDSKGASKYLDLAVGEREGDIEVVSIDPQAGTVSIKQSGRNVVLDFERNGAKAMAAAPAPPGQGGRPAIPSPPGVPGPQRPGQPTTALPTTVPGGQVVGLNAGANDGQDGNSGLLRSIPTRPTRLQSGGGEPQSQVVFPTPVNVSADESIIHVEIQRAANQDKINQGQFPPLPPTPLSQE